MKIASKASKVLLVIEAVAIAVLSIYGILFVISDINAFANGSPGEDRISIIELLVAIMIFCALISGWRIFGWVITIGPMRGRHISPIWWVFAALGASLTITILLVYRVQEFLGLPLQPIGPVLASVGYVGFVFLIPFTHLIIEVIWQRRMSKRL